ncbi:flagellar motor switch protein FliG [Anaeropeptidivorans aminofermentans]|jgi:flagellar motor switch protein FliG|uniref:flagellar motor switch protein FliG n=1 Tax=Anaeropeptidivorans aminofermentans TaxID=2934315 RepID=UPI0020259FA8|nr:flagellar motor switch protein FliG [Anaeropeptidivorans aminofermentans]
MPENIAAYMARYTGRQKAGILLITLGPEKSAQIFKHLKEEEIEAITLEIANITTVLPEVKEAVLDEFYQICLAQQYITEGGITYAKQILEKALGEQKAFEIISKMTSSLQVRPFDFVRKADANQVINFIQNEHPQTIALILSYLKPQQAGQVLSELAPEKQADVVRRIAVMNRTSPEVIKEVEHALEKKFSNLVTEGYATIGGIDSVVDILNSVDRTTEKNIMETLEVDDYELSDEIRKKMFIFDDIISLSNRDVQLVLRQDIDNKELAIALKGANEEVKKLIFSNLSKRLAAMIKEDMEFMGPVRKADVEEAQQKIVAVIRRLQDTGEIIVARGGGDEVIV